MHCIPSNPPPVIKQSMQMHFTYPWTVYRRCPAHTLRAGHATVDDHTSIARRPPTRVLT